MIGVGQGTGGFTINPATNTLGQTPESLAATTFFALPLRFSGANAFKREAPSTLEQAGVMKPAPVTLEELNAAINRVPQNQMMPEEAPPPSGPAPAQPQPQPQAAPPQPSEAAPPTHIYQGPEYDQPVTPTGNEQTHTDGRTYVEVKPPDGPVTWVPKEHLAEAPQPTPAGAQITPAAQSGLTPEQAAAAGSTADKQWYYKTIIPGEANNVQYIKGITPTMAQQELTTNAARDFKLLRCLSPDAEQNERELLARPHHSAEGGIPGHRWLRCDQQRRDESGERSDRAAVASCLCSWRDG